MNKKDHVHAVVLAGGVGSRFWPVSRQNFPKQFLDVLGEGSFLKMTVRRLLKKVPPDRLWIVTNRAYRRLVRKELAEWPIPSRNFLWEPCGKNTAPAICWAASRIFREDPEAVTGFFPADHLIQKGERFFRAFDQAVEQAREGCLVTFGIVPHRPETGYGYIQAERFRQQGKVRYRVKAFKEKPSLKEARRFIQRGYFWNSGMFVFAARTLLAAFERYLPSVHRCFCSRGSVRLDEEAWRALPAVSIDYGILEKAEELRLVPARHMGWSDIGSWEALTEVLPRDRRGNSLRGDVLAKGCQGSLIWGTRRLVTVIGVSDLIVVDTPDALLVCRKDLSQQVKEIVDTLKQQQRSEL